MASLLQPRSKKKCGLVGDGNGPEPPNCGTGAHRQRRRIYMATKKRTTVVGVFDTRAQAQLAVDDLRRAGFKDSQIAMVMHRDDQARTEVTDLDAAKAAQVSGESKAEEGAAVGAGAGAVLGGALAVATSFIPGVGMVLSIGTLAATIFGVAAGAAGGGVVGALVGLDFPEEDAKFYERELKAGRVLVGVKADERDGEAAAIMYRCGGYDATTVRPVQPETAQAPPLATPR
jgi:heat induced stress protein YflT